MRQRTPWRLLTFASLALSLAACNCSADCPGGHCADGGADGSIPDGGCRQAGNFVDNGGFECGTAGWSAQNGNFTASSDSRTGAKSGMLWTPDGGAAVNLWLEGDLVTRPGRRTFCAQAWLKGTPGVGRLTVVKVRQGSIFNVSFSIPLEAQWQPIPPPDTGPLDVQGEDEDKLLLRLWMPDAGAGATMYIDDVRVFESLDGGCK